MRGLGAGLFLFCACLKTPCGLDIMFTEKMTRERNEAIKKEALLRFHLDHTAELSAGVADLKEGGRKLKVKFPVLY